MNGRKETIMSKTINCTDPSYSVDFIANGGNENDIIAIACINDGESYGGSSYWFTIGSYSSIKNAIRWANKKLAKHGLVLAI